MASVVVASVVAASVVAASVVAASVVAAWVVAGLGRRRGAVLVSSASAAGRNERKQRR